MEANCEPGLKDFKHRADAEANQAVCNRVVVSKVMNRCQKCENELVADARFCNICGAPQNPENAQSVPPIPPEKSPDPARTLQPSSKRTHSPQVASSLQPAAAHTSSDLAIPPENPQPETRAPVADVQTQNKHPLSDLLTKHIKSAIKQGRQQTPVVRSSTPPSRRTPPAHNLDKLPTGHLPSTNGQNGLGNEQPLPLLSLESFIATSKAAEHWRNSWRDRQYAEAGTAENVSRGHAAVPMPLMAMQHSFARMRAIARPKKDGRRTNFRFWITLFLLMCIIAGLGTYIVSTYLPDSPVGAAQVVLPTHTAPPSLTLQGNSSGTFALGQAINLHGDHFGPTDTVTFLLDTTSPLTGAGGKPIATRADNQGAFDVALTIGSDWTTGTHTIEALASSSNQEAYLTIQVVPTGTPVTTSPDLSVTTGGKPVQTLTFKAVAGQPNPPPQPITITNTSGAPLTWSAVASANKNLSWFNINDHHTFGVLALSEPDTLLISVNIVGLTSNPPKKPYTGQIVFTISDKEQLTLPVQLQLTDATPEMVFSPSPLIAQGNTCNSGVPGVPVTLTLINLGSAYINWTVKPDLNISNHISFVDPATFKPKEEGQLAPPGQAHDTQVLVLQCNAIQVGRPYHVSVYANGMSWSELVIIQP